MPRQGALLSIREQQIVNARELGHGLSVVIQVAPVRTPIYDDAPGQPGATSPESRHRLRTACR